MRARSHDGLACPCAARALCTATSGHTSTRSTALTTALYAPLPAQSIVICGLQCLDRKPTSTCSRPRGWCAARLVPPAVQAPRAGPVCASTHEALPLVAAGGRRCLTTGFGGYIGLAASSSAASTLARWQSSVCSLPCSRAPPGFTSTRLGDDSAIWWAAGGGAGGA